MYITTTINDLSANRKNRQADFSLTPIQQFSTFPLLAIKIHFTGNRQLKDRDRKKKIANRILHQPMCYLSKIL